MLKALRSGARARTSFLAHGRCAHAATRASATTRARMTPPSRARHATRPPLVLALASRLTAPRRELLARHVCTGPERGWGPHGDRAETWHEARAGEAACVGAPTLARPTRWPSGVFAARWFEDALYSLVGLSTGMERALCEPHVSLLGLWTAGVQRRTRRSNLAVFRGQADGAGHALVYPSGLCLRRRSIYGWD